MSTQLQIGCIAAISLVCALPLFAQADVVKCSASDGTVTYTDSRCSGALMVGQMTQNRSTFVPARVHSTQWAEKIAPRQVRTDVESVRSAYQTLQLRENGAKVAEFTSD